MDILVTAAVLLVLFYVLPMFPSPMDYTVAFVAGYALRVVKALWCRGQGPQ